MPLPPPVMNPLLSPMLQYIHEIRTSFCCVLFWWYYSKRLGVILGMHPTKERRRYIVTSSLIGCTHTQNDPWRVHVMDFFHIHDILHGSLTGSVATLWLSQCQSSYSEVYVGKIVRNIKKTGCKPCFNFQAIFYQHWSHLLTPCALINPSPPGQNGHHFAEDIFRCIFVNEKFYILIKISLKFVPKGPCNWQ